MRKIKKEAGEYYEILCQIKEVMMDKVDEEIAKKIPVVKKKSHEYEAAKLLGLKSA